LIKETINDNNQTPIQGHVRGHLQVPNFDHYKTNRPDQFTAYMTWIEQNMKDKDAFLTGIDEQFQKLIGE